MTILVTGGTGSFGHAFVKRILDDNITDRVVVLSRDEWKQAQMRAAFRRDPRLRFFLGDVRDRERLVRAFRDVDTVVHAAALKQVDRSSEAFDEFVKTNVSGALNVIEACHAAGVNQCVALSTDKAVEATTPYGVSKAAAEWLFVGGNAWGPCRFSVVRYGNILGSRGSVLEIWRGQVARGEPLTVVDPAMTRFWLSIDRAVDLVLLALARMNGGEVFVPKAVASCSVDMLAKAHYPNASLQVVGKRGYEKMHEKLIADEERDRVRDCGDVYVVLPQSVHWSPEPYGADAAPVPPTFTYRSGP